MPFPRACGILGLVGLIATAAPAHAANAVQTVLDAGNHCSYINPGAAAPAGWAAPGFQASA